jgi:uncharacterized protein
VKSPYVAISPVEAGGLRRRQVKRRDFAAGGELLIPTLIFIFDIRTAGSAVLFVSIPTVCMGLFRYGLMGLLPSQWALLRVGVPMGSESLVGAAAGGAFAGSTSAEVLEFCSVWF